MDWKEQYEASADKERDRYDQQPVTVLLEQVSMGQYGDYNTLWRSLAERATLQEAALPLFSVLQNDSLDFLIRCNCAEALLHLLGREDGLTILEEAVNLSRGTVAMRHPYLMTLQHEINTRLSSFNSN